MVDAQGGPREGLVCARWAASGLSGSVGAEATQSLLSTGVPEAPGHLGHPSLWHLESSSVGFPPEGHPCPTEGGGKEV